MESVYQSAYVLSTSAQKNTPYRRAADKINHYISLFIDNVFEKSEI